MGAELVAEILAGAAGADRGIATQAAASIQARVPSRPQASAIWPTDWNSMWSETPYLRPMSRAVSSVFIRPRRAASSKRKSIRPRVQPSAM